MHTRITLAYEYCQRITKSNAKNFYYGFRTLPIPQRLAIYAAYAFCRRCDDIADGLNPINEKKQLLAQTRVSLSRVKTAPIDDPVFIALSHAIRTFDMTTNNFEAVIDGVEMDLVKTRYQSFLELKDYCYKVASAVGLICIDIFGYKDPKAKEYAVDLGVAMQLTNISRDIKEDALRGRIYVPKDEIVSFGYSESELQRGVINDAFKSLMKHQISRANNYFREGQKLLPLIPADSRSCPKLLIEVYCRLLERIEKSDFDVFSSRITLGNLEKLTLMAKLWATSLIPFQNRKR